ncbi:YigZ family protein [Clostridium sp. JN-9]|uniref:YigZ family protein n=1 Tax=Clostridium sp. JN-9 TaxID=2507159 RepID=UPI000FFE289D|nr:YigZ family protein [Clostridium sp. JN-9]QAT39488.1 YigZ family protein [Clostridium sp. JN-9]
MSYFTLRNQSRDEFEEKKSIFIGQAKRIYSEDEAREFIDSVRQSEKEARHNVYAYIIGENKGIQRYSDDGEPQGTGGIPVLEVIKKNNITDTVVVVTRYFGGILLGKGGLVRAYSKAAAMAVKKGEIVEKVLGCSIEITIDYDLLGKLQYSFQQKQWFIENIEYTDKVMLNIYCEENNIPSVENEVYNITNGRCNIVKSEKEYYFKLGNRLYKEQHI